MFEDVILLVTFIELSSTTPGPQLITSEMFSVPIFFSSTDDLEQVERLKWKLQEYELIIEQHRQLLLQVILNCL
jgi:hypothetical protein